MEQYFGRGNASMLQILVLLNDKLVNANLASRSKIKGEPNVNAAHTEAQCNKPRFRMMPHGSFISFTS